MALSVTACSAQSDETVVARGEFGQAMNGLIYSPQTMRQLRHIVDSLNLRHKVCDARPVYRSQCQGQAHYVRLDEGNFKQARQALEQGITPEAFAVRFPKATIAKNLLVVCYEDEEEISDADTGDDRKRSNVTVYRSIPFNDEGDYTLRISGANRNQAAKGGRWVIDHQSQTAYSDQYVEGFYFTTELTQSTLPVQYASMVQYADCLIDTTTQIYFDSAKRTGRRYQAESTKAQEFFMSYVHQQTQRPSIDYNEKMTEAQREARWRAYYEWDSLRLNKVDALAKAPKFRALLAQAVTDTNSRGATTDEFEEYVARYYSPKKALEFKRSRIVVGGCSQDDSPRYHALNIAQLSAETVNWETFLRAHLDIMNDRFERSSDGSYAWAARKTYLRELEELDIDVPNLMLGITLRIDKPSRNHYFGSLGRLGRALAETQQPRELEQRLLDIVADPALDTYNRVLAYYLFLNYNNYLENEQLKKQNVVRLNEAVQKLPSYLVARATVKESR
ncbi:hypothetical protein [Hymenobacter sp. HDW8]|uniref:hypothetical protein n=1 Tax=Hymenobacter sp. HDW8 TaxID=2714932 RepID=UPI001407F4BB|nr:hypothetical protein [Hymenobacter sp. HDW8]QIL75490.1 hypothetical protein G7064_06215 [Hymenobacter sp. HDW8]